MNIFTRKGFTLIEVLVVVAIIGILASLLMVNFGGARDSAKNKSLRAAMGEIQLALEVYKAQNRRYPAAITDLVPEYIGSLPTAADSGNSNCSIGSGQYSTDGGGTYYKFVAQRCYAGATSASTGIQPGDKFARCAVSCSATGNCNPANANYYESMGIYSVGAECS
jgi:prepilin-type N-terminal cleavage/methylation domain-containing protein